MSTSITIPGDGGTVWLPPPRIPELRLPNPVPPPVVVLPVSGPRGPVGPPGDTPGQLRYTGIAGMNLSGHRIVTPAEDGRLVYATNDDIELGDAPCWMTFGAAEEDHTLNVLMFGSITEPSWSWSLGPIYLGVDGNITQTPPTADQGAIFLVRIGHATSPTSVYVNQQMPIYLDQE